MNVWRIRDGLLMRGEFHKRPRKLDELRELGIDVVICMLRRGDPDLERLGWLEYAQLPLPDARTVDKKVAWDAAYLAADRIGVGKTVLVHCISSADRSPLVSALTLTILDGISGKDALQRVQSIKRTTFHNAAFIRFLEEVSER